MIKEKFWVVGIGASAGGLEALTQFVNALPKQSDACYVVAQHLAPHAKSMMVELLSRQSPIPVDVVVNERQLETNRLFIVPPNYDVEIRDGKLLLFKAGDETRPKPSVDRLFTSLAESHGARAIGVILSGTGSDGAEGIRAIKDAGGTTAVQEEGSAKYSGMPNSALETGLVDHVLPAAQIAKMVVEIVEGRVQQIPEPDEASPDFPQVIELIHRELGSDFTQYKLPTIKRRLAKRMHSVGIEDIGEYYRKIQANPGELRALAQDFLVSVTSFFRDAEAFEALSKMVKEIIEAKPENEEIRMWSAGCATGEEAYSLAMIVSDHLAATNKQHHVKIFATDLDTDAISRARNAIYHERDMKGLPPGYAEKYFEQRGELFEVRKSVRDFVVLARQDLIQSPPFVKLDLVCCRNVIIYFEPRLQQRIFHIFGYALRPGGVLFLGKSEALAGAQEFFEPVDKKAKIFVKKATVRPAIPEMVRQTRAAYEAPTMPRKRTLGLPTPAQAAQVQILERYGIAGAIVDAEGAIQTMIGETGDYLKIPSGMDSFRLQSMLSKSVAVEFQILLKKASKSRELHVSRPFPLANKSKGGTFRIQISPFTSREEASSLSPALMLVTFDRLAEAGTGPAVDMTTADQDLTLRAAELEQELNATREHLQTVIEELGVTNEELQSTNEELSSTNEELQSSNEELETTNEEFQSTNEELTTLNEELSTKSAELRSAITDLENIQSAIETPLLVVDEELRLQRFNRTTTELFDVSITDIGRNITRVSCRCEIEAFAETIKKVIRTGETHASTVETFRTVYQMRIAPRRSDDRIIGAVIMFINNTDLIQAEQSLRKSERRARGIIDGTSSLIFLKDMNGRYLTANQAFYEFFKLNEKEIIGKTDREIFPDRFANQMRNGDLEAVLRRSRLERQEEFVGPEKTASFLVSRFAMQEEDSASPYAVGTVAVDITAQVSAQENLRKSESLYRGVVEDQSVFVARFDDKGDVIFVNAAFLRYFGGSATDYIGKPFATVIDNADRAEVQYELGKLSQDKPIVQVEHRYSRFGTAARWVRWISKAVLNSNNSIQEIQAVGFDVTEYRQQTDQMVQREMLFSNIFTYTTDFLTVYKVSSNGELLLESFNHSVEEGAGYAYAQFLGRNVKELITSQHRDEILQKYRVCVTMKEPQNFDEEVFLQGGIKFLSTTVIPVLNHSGGVQRVVALSRDVSKYKVVEAELNAAKAAAEIANESKSDFLASMSHELRSPLNVVIGMSELLQEADLGEKEREQVKSIKRSGKVLLSLIEDILDLSKIEAGKTKLEYSAFSLGELATDVVDTFTPQAKTKGVKLTVTLPKESPDHFIGDGARVRQVLINLVGNAVKFTESGKVSVKVSTDPHATTGRRMVRFEVKDTGIGIPKEHHSRIFKKFSQVDSGLGRRYGGTGLGLVISQRLINLMNGQIGFTSEWNKGSTFWFELPLNVARTGKASVVEEQPSADEQKPLSAHILAVDDSPDSRMLLEMLLSRLGHTFEIVDSGAAALEALQKSDYDLVLMDVQMPGMDGYQTTVNLRRLEHPNHMLPVIALTANAMVGDSEKCFDSGMNDYITKPINVDLLRRAIVKWARISAETKAKRNSDHGSHANG